MFPYTIVMRKLVVNTLLFVALFIGVQPTSAQEFVVGANFATLFDNTEYASMTYDGGSETLFSARLTPKIGFRWAERNHLILGVDLVQDFGNNAKVLSDVNIQLYYNFTSSKVVVSAGIFPRESMKGLQFPLFFDRAYRYYNNRIQGVLARYDYKPMCYLEFAMDYTGMRSFDTRESFMIMSAARHAVSNKVNGGLHFGYDFLMDHYAKDYNPDTADGVVDNIMLTPVVGYKQQFEFKTKRPLSLMAEARYILSLQRDRRAENLWRTPQGGELLVGLEWYGVALRNRLYMGNNLQTHYDRYGSAVYYGLPFYRTESGIYDAIELCYKNSFFDNTINLEAGVAVEYDGTGWGTRQFILLGVNLDYGVSLKKKINN